jgi:hypothetical protein
MSFQQKLKQELKKCRLNAEAAVIVLVEKGFSPLIGKPLISYS